MRAPNFRRFGLLLAAGLIAGVSLASAPIDRASATDNDALDRIRKFAVGSAASRSVTRPRSSSRSASSTNAAEAAQSEIGQEAAGVAADEEQRKQLEAAEAAATPFGARLFVGQFARERPSGVNPDYQIQPGDRIAVNLFGAQQFSEVVPVDGQGNLFVPEVGPVPVAGVPNRLLQQTVESRVRRVFTDNVGVYVNLMGAQTLGVFVTGPVISPGRYSGLPNDSLLSFIDKAGGIDLEAGSFRDIRIMRQGEEVARADLYEFLLRGSIPTPQFKEGDVILIGPIGGAVAVDGEARSPAAYEFGGFPILGNQLVAYARPKADVTHVALSGFRNGLPFNTYLSYDQFLNQQLEDGDLVSFQADLRAEEVFVEVEGEHLGASRLAVGRGARLESVLDMIPVDLDVAATNAIYIRRESVARDQKKALDRSLDELERTALAALSQTSSQAEIRAQEAELVLQYVQRARSVQPDGRVVVSTDNGRANVRMEPGDQIVIPQQTDLVLISGEVTLPQTVAYTPGATVADYVARAGGYGERADAGKVIVIRASGEALRGQSTEIRRGDQILVLPVVDPKYFPVFSDLLEVMFRVAIIAATVIAL